MTGTHSYHSLWGTGVLSKKISSKIRCMSASLGCLHGHTASICSLIDILISSQNKHELRPASGEWSYEFCLHVSSLRPPHNVDIKRSLHESNLKLWKILDSQLVIILALQNHQACKALVRKTLIWPKDMSYVYKDIYINDFIWTWKYVYIVSIVYAQIVLHELANHKSVSLCLHLGVCVWTASRQHETRPFCCTFCSFQCASYTYKFCISAVANI